MLFSASDKFEMLFNSVKVQQTKESGEYDDDGSLEGSEAEFETVKGMLKNELGMKKEVPVPDIEPEAFRVMLNFIYTEDTQQLKWDNLFEVYKAGKKINNFIKCTI